MSWYGTVCTGACTINRPCAQQYVGKSQSCMVIRGRLIVHAPVCNREGRRYTATCRLGCTRRRALVRGPPHLHHRGCVMRAGTLVGKSQSCMDSTINGCSSTPFVKASPNAPACDTRSPFVATSASVLASTVKYSVRLAPGASVTRSNPKSWRSRGSPPDDGGASAGGVMNAWTTSSPALLVPVLFRNHARPRFSIEFDARTCCRYSGR